MSDGGPAFPQSVSLPTLQEQPPGFYTLVTVPSKGMTLRDYFAAHCMWDVLSHFSWRDDRIEQAAVLVWKLADVMLAARDSEKQS